MKPFNRQIFLALLESYDPAPFEINPPYLARHWLEVNHERFYDAINEFANLPDMNLSKERKPVILDIGCFPGTLFRALSKLFPDSFKSWDLHGTGLMMPDDFVKYFDEMGVHSHRVNHDPVIATDETRDVPVVIPFDDNSVDVIFCLEVIEHLVLPGHLILEMKRVIRPGGHIILTTPNVLALVNRLRLLFGLVDHLHPDYYFKLLDWRPHFHEYTTKELKAVFESQGFKVIKSKYQNLRWTSNMMKKKNISYRSFRRIFDILLEAYPPFSQGILMILRKEACR
jgi:SAM-dependent methyltransferase